MKDDLIRIEYKLDLIMFALQDAGIMQKGLPSLEGIEQDICAVCNASIKIKVNTEEGVLDRVCKCKLPKKAFKLQLITPTNEDKDANNRNSENEIPSNE